MRFNLKILVPFVVAVLLCGCGQGSTTTSGGSNPPPPPPPPPPPAPTVTLGSTAAGTTFTPGTQAAVLVPILTYSSSAGFTLKNFTVDVSDPQPMNLAIYSSGTSNCPGPSSVCAATLLCSDNAVTPAAGINTYNASSFSSCGTLSANTYYWLAVQSTGTSATLNTGTGIYCPGTGLFAFHSAVGAATLPASMGSQDEPSDAYCPAISATFTCSTSCGTAPVPWTIFTYAGNTDGAQVTTTNLASSTYGRNGLFTSTLSGSTTYSSTATHGFSTGAVFNGNTYTGGTLSIQRTVDATDNWSYHLFPGPSGSSSAVFGFWLYNTGNTQDSLSQFDLGELDGGSSLTVGTYGGTDARFCSSSMAPICFKVERSVGGPTTYWGDIPYAQNTWYFAVEYYVNGGVSTGCGAVTGPCYIVGIFDTSGTELVNQEAASLCSDGKSICIAAVATGNPAEVKMLNDGSGPGVAAGTWYYGPALLDPTGQSWSTLGATYSQLFFPDSPRVLGPQLALRVEKGLIPHAERRNGRWWSYALNRFVS